MGVIVPIFLILASNLLCADDKLDQKVTLDFKDTPLEEVVNYLAETCALNIIIDKSLKDKAPKITAKFKEMKLKKTLDLLCESYDLAYKIKEGVILLMTKEEQEKEVYLGIYDINDILYKPKDFPGPEISLTSSGVEIQQPAEQPDEDLSGKIEDMIREFVEPKSWAENPEVSLKLTRGMLLVRHNKKAHKQIKEFLNKLRSR